MFVTVTLEEDISFACGELLRNALRKPPRGGKSISVSASNQSAFLHLSDVEEFASVGNANCCCCYGNGSCFAVGVFLSSHSLQVNGVSSSRSASSIPMHIRCNHLKHVSHCTHVTVFPVGCLQVDA